MASVWTKAGQKAPTSSALPPGVGVSALPSHPLSAVPERDLQRAARWLGLPLPHDIDSNRGYQVHEFPYQPSLPLAQALPSKSFCKNINPAQPAWFSG